MADPDSGVISFEGLNIRRISTADPGSGVISFDGTENEEYFSVGSGVISFGGTTNKAYFNDRSGHQRYLYRN